MRVTGRSVEQLEKDKPRARCRRWRLWLSTGAGRRSRRFSGTWTEAQEALRLFEEEVSGAVECGGTFGEHARAWLAWREASGRFAENTLRNNRKSLRALEPLPIWRMRLSDVTPADCREAIASLSEGVSAGTVQIVAAAMRSVLAQAEGDGLVSASPMRNVKPPKGRPAERSALSPAGLSSFLDALDAMPLDGRVVAVYCMAMLGLRRGEALGLFDSDFEGGFCHVRRQLVENSREFAPPKSKSGVRTLPVPKRLQAKVDAWTAVKRGLYPDAETLCCGRGGAALTSNGLSSWWRRVRGTLGCEGMGMHQLRHSNLSLMARHMGAFDLQRYAGWSSIAPARTYIHDDMDAVVRGVADAWGD